MSRARGRSQTRLRHTMLVYKRPLWCLLKTNWPYNVTWQCWSQSHHFFPLLLLLLLCDSFYFLHRRNFHLPVEFIPGFQSLSLLSVREHDLDEMFFCLLSRDCNSQPRKPVSCLIATKNGRPISVVGLKSVRWYMKALAERLSYTPGAQLKNQKYATQFLPTHQSGQVLVL